MSVAPRRTVDSKRMSMSMDRTFKRSNTGLSLRGRVAAVGLENGRLDNFFLHGVGVLCATHLCD